MKSETRTKGPVHLRFDDGRVVVTPEDEDRFVLQSGQAVEACQMANAKTHWIEAFKNEYLARSHQWCSEHKDRMERVT